MSSADAKTTAPEPMALLVRCRRVDRVHPVQQHLRCPYCFGREAAVRSGQLERFCDFVEGVDPIVFGFPQRR